MDRHALARLFGKRYLPIGMTHVYLQNTLLPEVDCNKFSMSGIEDAIGTVFAVWTAEVGTVKRNLSLPDLCTARAGLAHLASGWDTQH